MSTPQTIKDHTEVAKETAEILKSTRQAQIKVALDKSIAVIQALREVSPNMTLDQVLVFLGVAQMADMGSSYIDRRANPIPNTDLREATGINVGTLTDCRRNLSSGAYRNKQGKEVRGMGLIYTIASDIDGRATSLYLTHEGRELAERIVAIFSLDEQDTI